MASLVFLLSITTVSSVTCTDSNCLWSSGSTYTCTEAVHTCIINCDTSCPTTINSAATTTQIRCSAQKCQNTQINCGYGNTDKSMHVCSVDCLGQGACYKMHFECNGDLAQCSMSGNDLDSIIDSELQCKNTETSNSCQINCATNICSGNTLDCSAAQGTCQCAGTECTDGSWVIQVIEKSPTSVATDGPTSHPTLIPTKNPITYSPTTHNPTTSAPSMSPLTTLEPSLPPTFSPLTQPTFGPTTVSPTLDSAEGQNQEQSSTLSFDEARVNDLENGTDSWLILLIVLLVCALVLFLCVLVLWKRYMQKKQSGEGERKTDITLVQSDSNYALTSQNSPATGSFGPQITEMGEMEGLKISTPMQTAKKETDGNTPNTFSLPKQMSGLNTDEIDLEEDDGMYEKGGENGEEPAAVTPGQITKGGNVSNGVDADEEEFDQIYSNVKTVNTPKGTYTGQ